MALVFAEITIVATARKRYRAARDYLHQGGYVLGAVCLSVSTIAQKRPNGFA